MKGTAMPYDHSAYNSGDSSSTPVGQQPNHQLQQQQQQQLAAHMQQQQQQHRQDQQHNAMQHGLHAATGTFFIPETQSQAVRHQQQQQQLNDGLNMTSMYNAQPPTTAEIDAILSAYGAPPNPSAAQSANSMVAGVDSAASAAAAYGHLSYPAEAAMAGQWNAQPSSSSRASLHSSQPSSAGYPGALQVHGMPQRFAGQHVGGYEGDSSNNSSTQTPGGGISSDDSGAGKRRRMTLGGVTPDNVPVLLPPQPNSARFAPLPDGSGGMLQRPGLPHNQTSTIDSMNLENMAEASLRRASEENAARDDGVRNHRRSHSGGGGAGTRLVASRSHPGGALESDSRTTEAQSRGQYGDNGVDLPHDPNSQGYSHAALKRSSYGSASGAAVASGGTSMAQGSSLPSLMSGGNAASHPPGLGSQVMRGPDRASLGHSAASDFTKRKGWSNRIVEELLDFVHVLDAEGRVLFASPSVYALTGWKAEELRGRQITEFIHPEDVDDVLREFNRTLVDHSDLLMYYRFRRKPQTAADKRQKRADIEEATAARSPSGSASESTMGDSSSNGNGVMGGHAGKSRPRDGNSEGRDEDDTEDHYEVFEATGHPYFPPQAVALPASGLIPEEDLQKILPEGFAIGGALNKPMSRKSSADSTKDRQQQAANAANAQGEKLQCFFCSCRIYPTKNVSMLDSFLELKLENERLRLLLAEMDVNDGPAKGSEVGEGASRKSLDDPGYHPDFYKSELEASFRRQSGGSIIGAGPFGPSQPTSPVMPSAPHPGIALERSMTTGTVNDESEDEEGSVAGGAGGTEDGKRKKKKPKPDDGDYVCTDCGRVDSPEWRKGPLGPKTLCNACGLRWAKKVKRGGVNDPNAIAAPPGIAPFPKKAQSGARPSGPGGAQRMMQPPGPPNLVGSPSFSGGSPIFMGDHQQRAMQRLAPQLQQQQQQARPPYPDARQQQQQPQLPRQPGDYMG